MYPRKTARAHKRRGSCYFTTGFGSTSAGFLQLQAFIQGGLPFKVYDFGRDQTLARDRHSSPSELECRTRRIVSR
jgi:hypothetical protein